MKLCAPGYIWPTSSEWDILIDRLAPGDIVVCNNASGPGKFPETQAEKDHLIDWQRIVERIQSKRASAIGYVPLGWFDPRYMGTDGRPADYPEILQSIINWYLWYNAEGIWFDEMTHDPISFSMLQGLHGMARRGMHPSSHSIYGLGLSLWNPGRHPTPEQYPMFQNRINRLPGSLWCTFEGRAETYLAAKPKPKSPTQAAREIHLIYECSPDQLQAVKNYAWATSVGYGSVTADGGDNPYDTAAMRLT